MERIQTAIAKARAAREGLDPDRASARPPAAAPGPAPPDAVRTAWEAIPRREPRAEPLRARRVPAFESGQEASEFDRLRTRVVQRMQAEGWRKVAIVSPTAGNGKSTVAANLAFSCARQVHLRTMLVELDLRRPGLGPIMDLPDGLDVSRVLAGEAELADHAVRLRDNLIVAPTRAMTRNASEFLQAPDTVVALDAMQRAYDPAVMLFDMPPMGASDDVIGFLSNVDCALIVAAAGMTTIDEIGDCEREVAERTEVLGVVLNKCRYERKAPGYGDYY